MTKLRVVLLCLLSLIIPVAVFGDTLTNVLSNIATQLPTNTTGSITAATLRGVLDNMATFSADKRPVDPIKDFGAKCDFVTDDHVALQAAVTAAVAQSRPLYIPGTFCANSASLTFSGSLDIIGDGTQTSIIMMTTDAPAFVWTVPSPVDRFDWHDFSIRQSVASTTAAVLTQGGSNTDFWTHGILRSIEIIGFRYGFEINNAGAGNWNLYDAVNCSDGVITQVQYCFYSPQGSGTGNIFTHLQPQIYNASSAVIRFEGSGKVVGDIIIADSQFCCGGSVLSIGPGTVYRSHITLIGSQFDAGVAKALDLDATGDEYTNIQVMGNNVGGATAIGLPTIADRSISDDENVGVRRAGTLKATAGAGTFSTQLFSLVFPSGRGAPAGGAFNPTPMTGWIGTSCSVVVQGLIGNVGASISKSDFFVTYNNTGSPTFTAGPTAATASAWTIGNTPSTNTMTISADITQTQSSIFEAQIICTGGMFVLNKF